MHGFLLAVATTSIFNDYPVFVDKTAEIEAIFDKGTTVEMLVKCKTGTAIIVLSPLEKTYCASDMTCQPSFEKAVQRSCKD